MTTAMNVSNSDLSTLDVESLLAICKQAKMSQAVIGDRIGVSQATVCNVKKGRATLKPDSLQKLRQLAVQLRLHSHSAPPALQVVNDDMYEYEEEPEVEPETPEEMRERIERVFADMEGLVEAVGNQVVKALLIDGAAGVGKSHTVETTLNSLGHEYYLIKGTGKAPYLYKTLFENQDSVLVLDDADDFLRDETCLNILKAALDTTAGERVVSYGKMAAWMEKEDIPSSFVFTGSVIVISNLQLDVMANGTTKLAPHIKALCSRALHCAMEMNTREEVLCRIDMIADDVLGDSISQTKKKLILKFFRDNMDDFKQFSLRELVKLRALAAVPNWENLARRGLLKSQRTGR